MTVVDFKSMSVLHFRDSSVDSLLRGWPVERDGKWMGGIWGR